MGEIWKPIPGYEGYYEASNCGRIRNVPRLINGRWGPYQLQQHVLKTLNVHDGYLQVKFCIDNHKEQKLVHRLVAETFIPNPQGLPQVNHKDGNPSNNEISNLEWCTASENSLHRCRVLKREVGRPKKKVMCLETGKIYESSHHAARDLHLSQGGIFMVCQGKGMTAGGPHFKFC